MHGLFACAGEDGVLECFDLRMKNSAGTLDAATSCGAPGEKVCVCGLCVNLCVCVCAFACLLSMLVFLLVKVYTASQFL